MTQAGKVKRSPGGMVSSADEIDTECRCSGGEWVAEDGGRWKPGLSMKSDAAPEKCCGSRRPASADGMGWDGMGSSCHRRIGFGAALSYFCSGLDWVLEGAPPAPRMMLVQCFYPHIRIHAGGFSCASSGGPDRHPPCPFTTTTTTTTPGLWAVEAPLALLQNTSPVRRHVPASSYEAVMILSRHGF